ncbi:MAG: protein kinase [Blastocatellia bacterium]|nr:protein kinase [Blastocatellia bacterium]
MRYCPICKRCYEDTEMRCASDGLFLVEAFPGPRAVDGKYRIDMLLGQGGMGSVYKATHLELDRVIALKVVLPDFVSSNETLERFRQEARAAARLNHPNVIGVYDFGVLPTGQAYLAMELLRGRSLRDEIEDLGMLSPERVVEILRPVCEAVHAAHCAGVIHRDLKPDNIVVETTDAGHELVKVVDFGIAKLKERQGIHSLNLTEPGLVMGTPHYMSPEQCRGEELDARSDVYSLGVTAYEMLSGRVPFDAPTPSAVIIQHAVDPPRKLRLIREDLSEVLETVVMKALSKNREMRQQSAMELLLELERAVNESKEPEAPPLPQLNQADRPTLSPEMDFLGNSDAALADIATLFTTGRTHIAVSLKLSESATLTGHEHVVKSLDYLPQSHLLVSASGDGTVRIWDTAFLQERAVLRGHEYSVNAAIFSPDGARIASAGADGTVRLWMVKGERELIALGHKASVRALSFAPDGRWLASACDTEIKLWDAVRFRQITLLEGHTKTVEAVKFSPTGNILASGSTDDTVRLWDMITKTETQSLLRAGHAITALKYSPDGRYLASAGRDQVICLWDLENLSEPFQVLWGHDEAVRAIAFSPDGRWLASGDWNGEMRIWDLTTFEIVASKEAHDGSIFALNFSPQGDILASGGYDTVIKLWKIEI